VLAIGRRADAVREALLEVGAPVDAPDAVTGGQCRVLGFDIADRAAWSAAREADEAAGTAWLPLRGAVLTAGGWRGGHAFHETDDATWRAMFEMNLETARGSLAALLPLLVAQRAGSIVLVGSRAAVRPWESSGAAAYAAAKAGLVALGTAVAAEVLDHGVRVNVVLPSTIDTPDNRAAMPQADHSRWVDTASLTDVIAFLLSDAARDVSGSALPVYGRAS
jgi:NAD(P)-dependent dehydrogenase (short-subunit alcohol dehydrogenase family)